MLKGRLRLEMACLAKELRHVLVHLDRSRLFGTEPPPYERRFLEGRLAYRIQELAYGGLKRETLERLEVLGEQIDGRNITLRRIRHEQRPIAGTRLIREYQGVELTVSVGGKTGLESSEVHASSCRRSVSEVNECEGENAESLLVPPARGPAAVKELRAERPVA